MVIPLLYITLCLFIVRVFPFVVVLFEAKAIISVFLALIHVCAVLFPKNERIETKIYWLVGKIAHIPPISNSLIAQHPLYRKLEYTWCE